jgi:two-component system chemotaxis response regulator CheB
MPEMDGLACLKRIMAECPRRVIMVSSLTTEGAQETLQALEYGAVDFLAKPGGVISLEFESVGERLLEILRTAAHSQLPRPRPPGEAARLATHRAAPARTAASAMPGRAVPGARKLVAVASSTGGPKALASFIPLLPKDLGAVVLVVQHMPAMFTGLLAARLDRASKLRVKEAEEGERLFAGLCLIAPGGQHLEITQQETVRLTKDPPIGGLRPCADITFRSAAPVYGRRALAVVLTGMGRDATEGCKVLHERGGRIIVESKETALIYGMPRSVAEANLAAREVPIELMAQAVVDMVDVM